MLLLKVLFGGEILEPNKQIKLAVFASGRGSNAKNIFQHVQILKNVSVIGLFTDRPEAGVLEYAREYDVPAYIVPVETNKHDQEAKLIRILEKLDPTYLCLCGYMRILSGDFVKQFTRSDKTHSQIINIHPSLLPSFPGKDGYGDAFKANVKESGVTIHFVDEGVDTGPIIKQARFERFENDDLESFKSRGLSLEHEIYRELLNDLNDNGDIVL